MGGSWLGADVLVIDDDPLTRDSLKSLLEARGHTVTAAAGVAEARDLLGVGKFALVLCEVSMPGESGLQLARHIAGEHPRTAVLMVSSAELEPDIAESALELGAYGYVIKPFRPKELVVAVAAALRRHDEKVAHEEVHAADQRESLDLRSAIARLEHSRDDDGPVGHDTLQRLTRAIEVRSHETGDHLERVGRFAGRLARRLGIPSERAELIQRASRLHDIGKVAISDDVLLKPGELTAEERAHMQRHAQIGYYVLSGSDSELLQTAAAIALSHHERFDGAGYPAGLSGQAIPLEGRIVAVVDVFDALTSDRVYRPSYAHERALSLMREQRGAQFDPAVLDAFFAELADFVSGESESVTAS